MNDAVLMLWEYIHIYTYLLFIVHLVLAPDYDRSCWTDVKETLGLDFANVSK